MAFKNALNKGHLTIVSTIAVSILIKALIIISTGLIDLETVEITEQSIELVPRKTFNENFFTQKQFLDYQPACEVLCNLNYNLTFGPGLTSQDAVQPFVPMSGIPPGMTTYTTTADVLRTEVMCETVNVTFATQINETCYSHSNISCTTSDCYLPTNISPPPNAGRDFVCSSNSTNGLVFPWTWNGSCTGIDADDRRRDRIAFATYVCGSQGLSVTGTICLPSYSIQPAKVMLDTSGNVLNVWWDVAASAQELPSISAVQLITKPFRKSDSNTRLSITDDLRLLTFNPGSIDQLAILALTTGPTVDRDALLDPEYLGSRMKEVVHRLGSQTAAIHLLTTEHDDSSPSIVDAADREERRLMVRTLPVRLMQSVCNIDSILVLLLMLKVTHNITPPSISTLGGIATILARSPRITGIFCGSGVSTLTSIEASISERQFSTLPSCRNKDKTFHIELIDREDLTLT